MGKNNKITKDKGNNNNQVTNSGVCIDKTIKLKNQSPGIKFLTMKKKNSNENMMKVSPFLVAKVIDNVCGGVNDIRMNKSCNLVIEAKNVAQAAKLIQITKLNEEIEVEVIKNEQMNSSKGVVFAPQLLCETNEILLENLKDQHVTEINRAKKRNFEGDLVDSGLLFITFSIRDIPQSIKAGYLSLPVRPFVPRPMQCFQCGLFGHIAKVCKAKYKPCLACGSPLHQDEKENKCQNIKKCKNCGQDHHTLDRKCPLYKQNQKIQQIRVYEKVSMKEAVSRFHSRNATHLRLNYGVNFNRKANEEDETISKKDTEENNQNEVNNCDTQNTTSNKQRRAISPNFEDVNTKKKKLHESIESNVNIMDTQ